MAEARFKIKFLIKNTECIQHARSLLRFKAQRTWLHDYCSRWPNLSIPFSQPLSFVYMLLSYATVAWKLVWRTWEILREQTWLCCTVHGHSRADALWTTIFWLTVLRLYICALGCCSWNCSEPPRGSFHALYIYLDNNIHDMIPMSKSSFVYEFIYLLLLCIILYFVLYAHPAWILSAIKMYSAKKKSLFNFAL